MSAPAAPSERPLQLQKGWSLSPTGGVLKKYHSSHAHDDRGHAVRRSSPSSGETALPSRVSHPTRPDETTSSMAESQEVQTARRPTSRSDRAATTLAASRSA